MGNTSTKLIRPGRTIGDRVAFELTQVSWFQKGEPFARLGAVCTRRGDTVVFGDESVFKYSTWFSRDLSGESDRAIVQKAGGKLIGLMNGHSIVGDKVVPLPICETLENGVGLVDVPDATIGQPWNIEGQAADDAPVQAVWFDCKAVSIPGSETGIQPSLSLPFDQYDQAITDYLIHADQY